jgi:hypothetical protein
MSRYYDRNGKPMSLTEWAQAFDAEDRHIGYTNVGKYEVSTVWLGLDHNWTEGGPPLIFETMVFNRRATKNRFSELYCARYRSEREAKAGHDLVVARLQRGETLD